MEDDGPASPPGLSTSSTALKWSEDEKPFFHVTQRPPALSEPLPLGSGRVKVPYTINRYLRDYQREGVKFIYHHYAKSRGCILGDDMGLGKTVQVISFLAAVLQKTGTWQDVHNNRPEFLQSQKPSTRHNINKVFLIVAPLSVLYNWKDELDTWGHFRVAVVHGVRKDEELSRVNRGRCEIALTTYETLRICLDQFNSVDWSAVIVDEAHKLKNSKSQVSQAMRALRCQVRVGLTGTVLQNNLEELWCLMDWARPGCLGSLSSFRSVFSEPIERGQRYSVNKRVLAEGRRAGQRLANTLTQCFLRRTKQLISDQLPKKDDRVVYCSLTGFQQVVYRAVLDTRDVVLLLRSCDPCDCSSGRSRRKCCYRTNVDGVELTQVYFSYLTILRKVANHVALLQSREGTSKKQEKCVTAVCEQVFKKCPEFTERCKQAAFEAMSDPIYSGKMKVLQKLLSHFIPRKDKVLLFSYSTKLLDVLESYCMADGLEYRRLDGNTKPKERVNIVKEFNSSTDINLCLVSTMAGGLGLNFVGANVVVLFDPTWNPANDLQAIDRAYRIGQCKDVTVFRLISLGTVEEIIYLRQLYKQQLQSSVIGRENARRYFEAVQGPEGRAGELFGIRNLFRLQTEGSCLTHRILQREGAACVGGVMTSSTQPEMESGSREPDRGAGAAAEQGAAAVRPGSSGHLAGVLDFSSASEDEDAHCSKSTAAGPAPGTSSDTHAGLWALLQERVKRRAGPDSDCSRESRSDKEDCDLENGHSTSTHSEEAREGSPGCRGTRPPSENKLEPTTNKSSHAGHRERTEEKEEDVHVEQQQRVREKRSSRFDERRRRRRKEAGEEESLSSSEDEAPAGKVKSKPPSPPKPHKTSESETSSTHCAPQRSVKFTGVRRPAGPAGQVSEKMNSRGESGTGTIDTLLGGLQEVSYTHSNQRVVGSSSRENQLSRAALRDVFQLHLHSQLPANHLLHTPESCESSDGGEDKVMPAEEEEDDGPHPQHPVTHWTRTSHHTHNATVSVGSTPEAVRKQQFEEMWQFFGAKSVQEFAEELVRSNSAQRLGTLRRFYSHQNPDLSQLITLTFPEAAAKPKTHTAPAPAAPETRHRASSKRAGSAQRLGHEEPTDKQEQCKKKKRFTNTHNRHTTAQSPPQNTHTTSSPESSNARPAPATDAQPQPGTSSTSKPRVRDQEPSPAAPPSPRSESQNLNHTPTNSSLITDLIGDTSILDHFFKPKRLADRPAPAPAPAPGPGPAAAPLKSRSRSRDFWDILNEGNEESINKLTDLSQVEKLCQSVSISTKSSRENTLDNSQLWKKNEKFLWK